MKVLHIVCPTCGAESTVQTEREDLSKYTTDIQYKRCAFHVVTAEERLVAAIFGEKV